MMGFVRVEIKMGIFLEFDFEFNIEVIIFQQLCHICFLCYGCSFRIDQLVLYSLHLPVAHCNREHPLLPNFHLKIL